MFKTHPSSAQANITALEYKEIVIAFERALIELKNKPNVSQGIVNRAQFMHDKAVSRYNAFIATNNLLSPTNTRN